MKAKHWLYLFPMLLLLLALAGCQSEPTLEERGYTVKVTYDYNGGTADSESRRVLYYKPGQPLLAPGDSVEFKEPTLDRFHSLDGWYLALTDAEGELLRGEDGSILTADTPFVWEDALATQSCTLVARWREKPAVELVVPGQQNILYPVDEGTRVTENMLGAALPDLPDQTFFDYFTDPECTQRAEFPLQMQQGQRVTLYTRWLEGDVLVVAFFGVVPVFTTYYLQTQLIEPFALILGFACGLAVDTLLVVNNYRDREQDKANGKKTLAVIAGEKSTEFLYLEMGFCAAALCQTLWLVGKEEAALLVLPYFVLHFIAFRRMRRIRRGKALNEVLEATARNILLFGVLLSIGLII